MSYHHHLLSIAFLATGLSSYATHLKAGELRYEHIEGLTYRVQGILYTSLASPADHPEILIYFDGVADTVPRTGIIDLPIAPSCGGDRMSIYETQHTYSGPGIYTISMEDQNRGSGIINVPNSILQSFCVSATLLIDPVLGPNNSVRFTAPAYFSEMQWSTLVHDPIAEEDDGDSLSFGLVVPGGLFCGPIVGYTFPNSPAPGWTWLDPMTGVYMWYMPNIMGEYTIAIQATEWRNGVMLGQVTRDMTFCVSIPATGVPMPSASGEDVQILFVNGEWIFENDTPDILRGDLIDARGAVLRTINLASGRTIVTEKDLPGGLVLLRTTDAEGQRQTFKLAR